MNDPGRILRQINGWGCGSDAFVSLASYGPRREMAPAGPSLSPGAVLSLALLPRRPLHRRRATRSHRKSPAYDGWSEPSQHHSRPAHAPQAMAAGACYKRAANQL